MNDTMHVLIQDSEVVIANLKQSLRYACEDLMKMGYDKGYENVEEVMMDYLHATFGEDFEKYV